MLSKLRLFISILLSAALLMSSVAAQVADLPLSQQITGDSGTNFEYESKEYPAYEDYIKNQPEVFPKSDSTVSVSPQSILADGAAVKTETVLGKEGYLWTQEVSELTWTVAITTPGRYSLSLEYYLPGENAFSAKRNLKVDGKIPFDEAMGISFHKTFTEINKDRKNSLGDELRGQIVPVDAWKTMPLIDSMGILNTPFEVYFEAGTHTVTLVMEEKEMVVGMLSAIPVSVLPSYAEVKKNYLDNNYEAAAIEGQIDFEVEDIVAATNDITLRRESSSDISVTPYTVETKTLNTYGSSRWKTGNQSIDMKFSVEKSGLYQIALFSNQNMTDGLPVYRQIAIDGFVPFKELLAYRFPYTAKYSTCVIEDDNKAPYLFYLEEGEHTITMTVKLGEMDDVIKSMEQDMLLLSKIQLDITKITGNNPDPNYDYEFFTKIPNLKENLITLSKSLEEKVNYIKKISGRNPSVASSLKSIRVQIDAMIKNPFSIAKNYADLGNAQTKLGTWYLTLLQSGMSLDKLSVASPDTSFKKVNRSFLKLLWANFKTLMLSFSRSYTEVAGSIEEGVEIKNTINVWVARGVSWAELIKELSDTYFTPKTGIEVRINTVPASQLNAGSANVLMLSIVSGRQPDVAMAVSPDSPVEFAIRDAVVDLKSFADFNEVSEQFYPETFTPFQYQKGVYGLPETMDFLALFYRKDILSSLNIAVPDTRVKLYSQTLPALYNQGLSFYYPRDDAQFILQHGGSFYSKDGLRSALDSKEVYQALTEETELYTQYSIPVTANLYNRFRTGEMPMGIGNYTLYLQLLSAAPEIAGRWGIAPLPGLVKEDGTVDRTNAAFNSVADVILSSSDKVDESWEFLKWWSSYDTQTEFAREVEALLGSEARWNTANVKAFESLPWKTEDLKVIKEMQSQVREIPVVLGGYYTSRHLTNAWNRVVLGGEFLRDALEEAVEAINKELKMKQEEYGVK